MHARRDVDEGQREPSHERGMGWRPSAGQTAAQIAVATASAVMTTGLFALIMLATVPAVGR